jgi:hypothetical protein
VVAVTDGQRNAALEHLRLAVGASNLGLEVYSDAVGAVLAAPTADAIAQILQHVAPVVSLTPVNRRLSEPVVLEARSGRIEVGPAWQVARTTKVVVQSGSVVLDLTAAEFDEVIADFDLSVQSGSITVIVPHTIDVQFVEMNGQSGTVRNQIGPAVSLPGAPLVRIRARTTSGRIVVRRPEPPKPKRTRRFWFRRPPVQS